MSEAKAWEDSDGQRWPAREPGDGSVQLVDAAYLNALEERVRAAEAALRESSQETRKLGAQLAASEAARQAANARADEAEQEVAFLKAVIKEPSNRE